VLVDQPPRPTAPETWPVVQRIARRAIAPIERFLQIEAASGIVLLIAAALGLVWANSRWAASYEAVLHMRVLLAIGSLVFDPTVHFLINDGAMTIFFFVVGLEIRREIHEGELSELKKAALPIAAALGGMIVPALLYSVLNEDPVARRGWGVPMATDIAFAVGVLALLGRRVSPALRVLLLALAIIDDIGAIVVIAVFYSSGVALSGILVAAAGVLGVRIFQRLGVRRAIAYVVPGAVVWAGLLQAGVHPTIAGVILGLLTPARAWFGKEGFVEAARAAVDTIAARGRQRHDDAHGLLEPLRDMHIAGREALPPVVRIQATLHPWVAFGIMPLFALANAGVPLQGFASDDSVATAVFGGALIGLVLGKPIGIVLASYVSVKLGMSALPRGVSWRGVTVVGVVGGIGFTMSIFIANLAFSDPGLLAAAKLGVLVASAIAAVFGWVMGRVMLPAATDPMAARTLEDAERAADR
jgi:Na+:H+ antiporter, NhaA family